MLVATGKTHFAGVIGDTLRVNPSLEKILSNVSRRGVVLFDSIRATDDWGMSQRVARSR